MRRLAAKVDSNQSEIVQALRAAGASVYPTHTIGKGFVDLVIGYNGVNYLAEVKDSGKPKSKRKLTADEEKFFSTWAGQVAIIESVEDAIALLQQEDVNQTD